MGMTDSLPATIPVIRLWDVLLVPIQGDLADHEAERLADGLLTRIHKEGARGLVIDLSGVWMLDSHLCAVVVRLSRAARLLGTSTTVTGLSPEVALTLQSMGLDLGDGRTARTLEEALTGFGLEPRAHSSSIVDEEIAVMHRLLADDPTAQNHQPGNSTMDRGVRHE
jgi:rsbT antagonist protein RsbS